MRSFRAQLTRTPQYLIVISCLLLMATSLLSNVSLRAQQPSADIVEIDSANSQTRIRLAFGGATPTIWQGEMVFTGLKPSQLQQLSLEPSSVGAAWLEGNRLIIRHDRPISRDAYDVTLVGPLDSELEISLSDGNTDPVPVRINLSDIRRQAQTQQLGDLGRFVAERMPDDRLHIEFDKPTRIYEPNDRLKFTVSPDTEELEPTDFFDFKVALSGARSERILWQGESTRYEVPVKGLAECPVEIPLPTEEGVYNIQLTIERPAGFTSRFLPNGQVRPFAQRSFQVLVFDKNRKPEAPSDWVVIEEINPASSPQASRIPEWMDWRRLAREEVPTRLASFDTVTSPFGIVSLPKAKIDDDGNLAANWQAIALPNLNPGVPYLIEIEHGNQLEDGELIPQSLGVTILDKSSQGELVPLNRTLIHNSATWNPQENESIKVLIWPRTSAPLLVVSNPSTADIASLGKIRIYRSEGFKRTKRSQRQLSLRWRDPQLEASVGASLAPSPGKLYEVADLQTRFEVSKRIADRVQIAGANGAIIPLNSQGGSLTSIPSLSGTPRFNMATWAFGSSDLPPIDPLEILLLEFDRRRLDLTPCLSLDEPLPQLEKRRRYEQDSSYLWSADSDSQRYNPLHAGVSEEIQTIGKELRDKYEHHRSLGRLSFQIGSRGALIQPNLEGGFETRIVDQFLKENQLNWPENLPRNPETHAEVIEQNIPEAWEKWKQQRYDRAAYSVSQAYRSRRGQAPLIFADKILYHEEFSRAATPKLGRQIDLNESFEILGVSSLLKPGRMSLVSNESASSSLPNRLIGDASFWNAVSRQKELISNQSLKVTQLLSDQVAVRLVRSSDFFGTPQSPNDFLFEATIISNETAAQRLVESSSDLSIPLLIETSGSEEGWYSEELITLRKLFTSTPTSRQPSDKSLKTNSHDVKISVSEQANGKAPGTVLIASNKTAWKRQASVTIEVPHRSLAIPISSDLQPEWFESGKHALKIELEPYQAIAWRFSSIGIQCVGIRVDNASNAVDEISKRVEQLKLADHSARRQVTPLRNPSFEERREDGQAAEWELINCPQPVAKHSAIDGNYALTISSQGDDAMGVCTPFTMPSTGQLAIQFQATSIELEPDSEFVIEFLTTDGKYQSRTTVNADQLPTLDQNNEETWTDLIFAVDDLPIGVAGQMQVRFILIGKGTILVDNLRCEDLMLPLPAYIEDTKSQKLALVQLKLAAQQALDEGRLADCQQILDSYWGKFLVTNFPQLPPVVQEANTDTPVLSDEAADPEKEEEASVADRFRGYWPKIWR